MGVVCLLFLLIILVCRESSCSLIACVLMRYFWPRVFTLSCCVEHTEKCWMNISVLLLWFLRVSEVWRLRLRRAQKLVWRWARLSAFYMETWTWEQLCRGERASLSVVLTLSLCSLLWFVRWSDFTASLYLSHFFSWSLAHSVSHSVALRSAALTHTHTHPHKQTVGCRRLHCVFPSSWFHVNLQCDQKQLV